MVWGGAGEGIRLRVQLPSALEKISGEGYFAVIGLVVVDNKSIDGCLVVV